MSLNLFCLVKGNTAKHAFEVVIEADKSVSALKKAIKAEQPLVLTPKTSNYGRWKFLTIAIPSWPTPN